MQSRYEARYSSLLETKTYMQNKILIWTGDTPITSQNTKFSVILVDVAKQQALHVQILIGYTIEKHEKEAAVINDLLFLMPSIRTWAAENNKSGVKGAATMAESDIAKLSDTLLLAKAKDIKKLIEDNPGVIDPDYVPAARKTAYDANIVAYEDVIEMPETLIAQRAEATQAMNIAIDNGVKLRKDTFLDAIKRKREAEPDFFKGFKQAMKINNNPTHKLSFIGHILRDGADDGTGTKGSRAIANVRCFIPALNKFVLSGEKGNFLFKSLPAGEYQVVFTKFGYEPITATIAVNDHERTEINIIMKPKVFPV
jgi:hypothetical protein